MHGIMLIGSYNLFLKTYFCQFHVVNGVQNIKLHTIRCMMVTKDKNSDMECLNYTFMVKLIMFYFS